MKSKSALIIPLLLACCFSACVSAPVKPVEGYTPAVGAKAAATAKSMIGRPYKYKGDSPAGFDCSGLVRYSYLTAGVEVPHGTEQLLKVTRTVSVKARKKGDLLFFNENGKKASHVGIYTGSNKFVHAPSTGGKVREESLADPYWKRSFLEARRFN